MGGDSERRIRRYYLNVLYPFLALFQDAMELAWRIGDERLYLISLLVFSPDDLVLLQSVSYR